MPYSKEKQAERKKLIMEKLGATSRPLQMMEIAHAAKERGAYWEAMREPRGLIFRRKEAC